MKKIFLIFLLLSSCTLKQINETKYGINLNNSQTINIGDDVFSYESMTGEQFVGGPIYKGSADKFVLKFISIVNKIIKIEYSEYTKNLNEHGGYILESEWLAKPAFNKIIEYDLNLTKEISYKNFKFIVENIGLNKVTIKRIN